MDKNAAARQLKNLEPGARIHFLGICGTAMASLAGILQQKGFHVTGSDSHPYPPMSTQIEQLGIRLFPSYDPKNLLEAKPDFVIVGNVISSPNVEVQEVLKQGLPYTSLPKALGEFVIEDRVSLVVSGTHGKTTTTSLLAWLCHQAGLAPGYLIGGVPLNFEFSFAAPTARHFVIEGDEYDTAFFDKVPKFIHYRPTHAILTSVEFDHADIYQDLDDVKRSFAQLAKLIPANGSLTYWCEDANVREVVQGGGGRLVSYGLRDGEYQAKIEAITDQGTQFQLSQNGQNLGPLTIPMSGDYNVLNATAVAVLALQIGIPWEQIQNGFASFKGVKRRQEVLGEPRGILVIEDFAHHPTAVRVTLQGLREKYQGRRLLCAFEPRSATSRRRVFQKAYVESFAGVTEAFIADAYDQSKIQETDRFSSQELVQDLAKAGVSARVGRTSDEILAQINDCAKPGDVVVLMSNGGFGGIYPKLLKSLELGR